MLFSHVNLGLELAHDVHVAFRDVSLQRGKYGFLPMAVDDTSMNFFHEHLRVGDTLTYLIYHALVALAVRVRHIVTQADVATLHNRIELAKLADNLVVKVIDTAVVLPQLLDALWWHITPTHQILLHALGYPLCILHIALVTGKLLDEIGIDEFQLEVFLQRAPHWNPIDAGTLHADF